MNRRGDGVGAAAVAAPTGGTTARRQGMTGGGGVLVVVVGAVATAVWATVALHVAGGLSAVDPLALTISDYVVLPGGHLVLAVAASALGAGAVVLAVAARRAGAGPVTVGAWGSWALAMVVAGIVPTNAPGTPSDLAADVHRWAGAWAFAILPVAAVLLARGPAVRPAARSPLTGLAAFTGVLAAAFLLAHAPVVLTGAPPFALLGALERLLYAAMLALLVATAASLRPRDTSGPAIAGTGSTSLRAAGLRSRDGASVHAFVGAIGPQATSSRPRDVDPVPTAGVCPTDDPARPRTGLRDNATSLRAASRRSSDATTPCATTLRPGESADTPRPTP